MGKSDTKEKKVGFKLPHLMWILLGLILIMSLLTYVIPAGQFGTTESGAIDGSVFNYLGHQTPVSPYRALYLMQDGLVGSAVIIMVVLIGGAATGVVLATNAFDNLLNWAIFKLKDKGQNTLIILLMVLLIYLSGFGGGDYLIALVPLGVAFSRKLRLDPITAIAVTTFATLVGFGTGPNKLLIPQTMMDVVPYSGFGMRFLIMNFFMVLAIAYVLWYVNRIKKDPSKSAMGNSDWVNLQEVADESVIKETNLSWRDVLIVVLFFAQYILIVWYSITQISKGGNTYNFLAMVQTVTAILCGIIGGMKMERIANEYAKGLAGMAFVGFIIGMARVVSLVMSEGNIIHTIVYTLTRPLQGLNRGFSAMGLTVIISFINIFIPSASSKAAILMPIIKPVTEVLGMNAQIAVQAFQFGDGFTNILSPALGWTVGSCAAAGVPFEKWFKWALPPVAAMTVVSLIWIYILNSIGWVG
ncbi:MAG TPA: Na+/H+ antiporter NhaC family protein [Candidatus Acidoferrum sp.]|nr:Na+/H+ antiporter NhaC family protein [Candidatus Acidoferrum sp.]